MKTDRKAERQRGNDTSKNHKPKPKPGACRKDSAFTDFSSILYFENFPSVDQ